MPELPEVETVKNGLKPIIGCKLENFILHKDGWRTPVPIEKINSIIGKPVIDVYRRAKWLALIFEAGCLWIHLGMSGKVRLFQSNDIKTKLEKHDHIELFFSDNNLIRFNDARRFGRVAWTDLPYSDPPSREELGPEPLSSEWTNERFYNDISKYKKPIKPLIMDSRIVVGVGNIYASEALFLSKISPLRLANSLNIEETSILREKIIFVLNEGIKAGGSTLKDHRTATGESGDYQKNHKVYGKENQPCPICQTLIVKINQAGRSSFYCTHCQK